MPNIQICKHGITPKSACIECRREAQRNYYKSPEIEEKIHKWQAEHPEIPLDKLEIKIAKPKQPKPSRVINCAFCGKTIEATRPWQKYCSDTCRHKDHKYNYTLSPEQREWKLQHMAEMRLSNPEYFKQKDARYRDTHYIKNGRTQYTYEEDPQLDYELTHDIPIRAFIPLPEKYKDNPAKYFEEGIILLNQIPKNLEKKRIRLRA